MFIKVITKLSLKPTDFYLTIVDILAPNTRIRKCFRTSIIITINHVFNIIMVICYFRVQFPQFCFKTQVKIRAGFRIQIRIT